MTLDELITDLKAAGANENTLRLAMNCYQLAREELIYSSPDEWVLAAINEERKKCAVQYAKTMRDAIAVAKADEREACAKVCESRAAYYDSGDDDRPESRRGLSARACANAIRARREQ